MGKCGFELRFVINGGKEGNDGVSSPTLDRKHITSVEAMCCIIMWGVYEDLVQLYKSIMARPFVSTCTM